MYIYIYIRIYIYVIYVNVIYIYIYKYIYIHTRITYMYIYICTVWSIHFLVQVSDPGQPRHRDFLGTAGGLRGKILLALGV